MVTKNEAREKIQMAILSRLQRNRTHAAAVSVLRPLIERANVATALKEAALTVDHDIPLSEFVALGPEGDVKEILGRLAQDGSVLVSPSGEYTSALELPDLSSREAGVFALKILHGWPEEAREKILSVFRDAAGPDDEEDN